MSNNYFFCQRGLRGVSRLQGSGVLQGRFIASIHMRRRLGILAVGAPADINVDILHTHPANFLNGLFPLDNTSFALGVMGDPIVVEVGNVHTDLQGGDYRGRENAPFYLPFVAEKIADVKELPMDQVLSQTYQNSLRTFFPHQ